MPLCSRSQVVSSEPSPASVAELLETQQAKPSGHDIDCRRFGPGLKAHAGHNPLSPSAQTVPGAGAMPRGRSRRSPPRRTTACHRARGRHTTLGSTNDRPSSFRSSSRERRSKTDARSTGPGPSPGTTRLGRAVEIGVARPRAFGLGVGRAGDPRAACRQIEKAVVVGQTHGGRPSRVVKPRARSSGPCRPRRTPQIILEPAIQPRRFRGAAARVQALRSGLAQ